MIGMLVTSKAGHDKEELYLIVREEKGFVYLADGKEKTLEHAKKKNKKHIQVIKNMVPEDLVSRLKQQKPVRNEEIKRVITLYKAEREG